MFLTLLAGMAMPYNCMEDTLSLFNILNLQLDFLLIYVANEMLQHTGKHTGQQHSLVTTEQADWQHRYNPAEDGKHCL